MSWVELLRKRNQMFKNGKGDKQSQETKQKEEEELLTKHYLEYKEKLHMDAGSKSESNKIPRFYFKVSIYN